MPAVLRPRGRSVVAGTGSCAGARVRIGVLGGTFDPVHIGHLRPALDVQTALRLDHVRLVPCHLTPHRPQPERSSTLRADLTELATRELPGFVVDDREMQRDEPSYTVDTLASMRAEFSESDLYFMLGVDSLNGLDTWHRWRDLLALSHLVLMRRPGYALNDFARSLLAEHSATDVQARERRSGCIVSVDTTELRVSSTAIRALLSRGGDPRYLVPDPVRIALLDRTDYQDDHD